ncbi:PaaI family thioesterase [Pararhodospirillum oryzae]|uniref:Medium/long-chain acyl-CoA thioesterase YigI n=1 Tax=Pararhodospirillum oryzae TaxID=478448 RepID=A0A512H3E3_9PROT|nr:PaaI family thioesterase [Pararhodospirillum oryzae]GEO79974.1 thioesterase [Pararhodospirillum oryzae]
MPLEPSDPDFAQRVQASFEKQAVMGLLGVTLDAVGPGTCTLRLPFRADLCQQHGYLHAGITTTLADTACGYAAYSLMPAESSVVSVEFKINLLAPAVGEAFLARAQVDRSGKTLSVVRAEVVALRDGREVPVALMQATMICLPGGAV